MEKFNRQVVDTIAKRAANICSNIDCAALTIGPAEEETRAVNVGEAAHIYGARLGSARFNPSMSDAERGDITNAIWLCRNCHKIADSDALRFPPELLFEWRRTHEKNILEKLGKPGALLQFNISEKQLVEFKDASYLAQQIILDKPYGWEYKLTAEFLRSMLEPIKLRWLALEKGLYANHSQIITQDTFFAWLGAKFDSIQKQIHALGQICNGELQKTWGAPGEPGSASEIYRVCGLLAQACQKVLEWEEEVRFASVPKQFEEMQELLIGVAGSQTQKIFEIPNWFAKIFSTEKPTGTFEFEVVFELPPNWEKNFSRSMKKVERKAKWGW